MATSATEKQYGANAEWLERTRHILEHPTGGIVGLVDELLRVCLEYELELAWQADECRVRLLADGLEERISVPGRKSIIRAIFARIAALCNEHKPNSVSPYGGVGELTILANPSGVLHVSFVNTIAEQHLEVTPSIRVTRPEPASTN